MKSPQNKEDKRDAKGGMSRRGFLQTAGVAAIAAGTVGIAKESDASVADPHRPLTLEEQRIQAARAAVKIPPSPLDNIAMSSFTDRIKTKFTVRAAPSETVLLECVAVEDLNIRGLRGIDNFVVCFRGPVDKPLDEGIYGFSHDSLTDFDLQIAPFGRDEQGLLYTAAFCRFTP